MNLLTGLLVAILFHFNAHARLGETMEEAITRYGEPLEKTEKLAHFQKDGYDIYLQFFNGKCWCITIGAAGEKRLSTEESDVFRSKNKPDGFTWKYRGTEKSKKNFSSSFYEIVLPDGTVFHSFDDNFSTTVVYNKTVEDSLKREGKLRRDMEAKEKMKGL